MKKINYKLLYNSFHDNKYITGLALLVINIFSKYVQFNLSKSQEEFLKNSITREFFIFTILFIGTRDLITSLILTLLFFILSNTFFHENSFFSLIPEKYKKLESALDTNKDGKISKEEIDKAIEMLKKINYN